MKLLQVLSSFNVYISFLQWQISKVNNQGWLALKASTSFGWGRKRLELGRVNQCSQLRILYCRCWIFRCFECYQNKGSIIGSLIYKYCDCVISSRSWMLPAAWIILVSSLICIVKWSSKGAKKEWCMRVLIMHPRCEEGEKN